MSTRPSAVELLTREGALLSRTDLAELGLPRRAIDSVFRKLDVVMLPGFSRPFVKAEDYRRLVDENTYQPDQVRPC